MSIFKRKIRKGDNVIVYAPKIQEVKNCYIGVVTEITPKKYTVQTEFDGDIEVPRIQIERIDGDTKDVYETVEAVVNVKVTVS